MKKVQVLILVSFIGTCLLLSQCKKNGSTPPASSMSMILLTQSSWKYDTAGIGIDSSGTIAEPLPSGVLMDCEKDNIITFKIDSTGTDDEGLTKCNASDPQTTTFTWSFNANQTVLNSTDSLFTGFGGDIAITSLTQTQLHLLKVVTVQSFPIIVDIYLKH